MKRRLFIYIETLLECAIHDLDKRAILQTVPICSATANRLKDDKQALAFV